MTVFAFLDEESLQKWDLLLKESTPRGVDHFF